MKEDFTLVSCIRTYLKAQKLDGYSNKTLYSYKLHLQGLVLDLDVDTAVQTIKLEHLRAHLTSLTHLQTSSLANKVRALKAFFK